MHSELFYSWADILPDALLLIAPEGRVLAANAAATRLLGTARRALVGEPLAHLVYEGEDELRRYVRLCLATRDPLPGSLTFKSATANPLACRSDGAAIVAAGDVRPEAVLIRLRPKGATLEKFRLLDGTLQLERLAFEIESRKAAEEQLRRERELLRVTLGSIGDAVIATDAEERITFLNAFAAELTGWSVEDAIGKPLNSVFRIINEKTRQPVANPVQLILREGMVVGLANHTLLLTKDNREIPIDDSAAPIRSMDGEIIGIVLVFRDITQRRIAETRIEEAYRQLESKVQERTSELSRASLAKDEFLMTLSHELRTPLTPLISALHLLSTDPSLSPKAQSLVEMAERNARAQVALVDDLLDISAIMSGKLTFQFVRTSALQALHEAVQVVRPSAEAKGLKLITAPLPEFEVQGDPNRLRQVFWNILANAVKFTPRGGTVKVESRIRESTAEVIVADTGAGISPEFLPRLFEKFSQSDSSSTRPYGGLGLGLSISRYIIEAHGGHIEATSPGVSLGATFKVILPIAR